MAKDQSLGKHSCELEGPWTPKESEGQNTWLPLAFGVVLFFPVRAIPMAWEVPGLGVQLEPKLPAYSMPQQPRIWAASMTYTAAPGNTGSLTHWEGTGTEPASSWIPAEFLTYWATTGAPLVFDYEERTKLLTYIQATNCEAFLYFDRIWIQNWILFVLLKGTWVIYPGQWESSFPFFRLFAFLLFFIIIIFFALP